MTCSGPGNKSVCSPDDRVRLPGPRPGSRLTTNQVRGHHRVKCVRTVDQNETYAHCKSERGQMYAHHEVECMLATRLNVWLPRIEMYADCKAECMVATNQNVWSLQTEMYADRKHERILTTNGFSLDGRFAVS